jgi:hypothetical protein
MLSAITFLPQTTFAPKKANFERAKTVWDKKAITFLFTTTVAEVSATADRTCICQMYHHQENIIR